MISGVHQLLRKSDYVGALTALRNSKVRSDRTVRGGTNYAGIWLEQDRVVYWMEEGMLALLAGRHEESIAALERARDRITELYTRSRRKIQASMVGTDIFRDYAGPPHEQRLVHALLVLNYLLLGKPEAARVAAARSDELAAIKPGPYRTAPPHAFSRWISGVAHELAGERDDARISYQQALEVYRGYQDTGVLGAVPPWIAQDMALEAVTSRPVKAGELVLFHFNGQGPTMKESNLECQSISFKPEEFGAVERWHPLEVNHRYWFTTVRDTEPWEYLVRDYLPDHRDDSARKWRCGVGKAGFSDGPHKVAVRVPLMVTRQPGAAHAVVLAGGVRAVTRTVHPLARLALRDFELARHRVHVRAVIRMSSRVRYSGSGAGWAAEDRRHWTTLPHRIDVARLRLPPGEHEIKVRLREGAPAHSLGKVVVHPGKRVFRALHSS